MLFRGDPKLIVVCIMPNLCHVLPVSYFAMGNGFTEVEHSLLGLGLIPHVGLLLVHTHHYGGHLWFTHHSREAGSWGIFPRQSSLTAARSIINHHRVVLAHCSYTYYLNVLDHFWELTVRTAFTAASSKSTATSILRLLFFSENSFNILLARSALVPVSLQTKGIWRLIIWAAVIIPVAMVSHFMIPPKILMRMVLTLGWEDRISKAVLTWSTLAPPPTSKKLAGSPPFSLMMSMVAMASPAPLTMQPMLPSRATQLRPAAMAWSS